MMDSDPSNRIHPDGVPGTEVMRLREAWGDAYYEQWRARGDRLNDIEEARQAGVRDQQMALALQGAHRAKREGEISRLFGSLRVFVGVLLTVSILAACVGTPALVVWLWGLR